MEHIFKSGDVVPDATSMERILTRLKIEEKGEDKTQEEFEEGIGYDIELLRDFVDQVDNGADFGKLEGFKVLSKLATHSNNNIRAQSWWTIGESCSNNPDAIEHACNDNIMQSLLMRIFPETETAVLIKQVYALGTLIRQDLRGINEFIKLGGENVLRFLLDRVKNE
eukprot:UN33608